MDLHRKYCCCCLNLNPGQADLKSDKGERMRDSWRGEEAKVSRGRQEKSRSRDKEWKEIGKGPREAGGREQKTAREKRDMGTGKEVTSQHSMTLDHTVEELTNHTWYTKIHSFLLKFIILLINFFVLFSVCMCGGQRITFWMEPVLSYHVCSRNWT